MNTTNEHIDSDLPRHEDIVDERLVRWYFFAALTFLGVSMLGGLLMAAQLIHWNVLTGIEFLSPGRWRMIHTNAVAYGFLANAFLGMLHWTVPRLTLHPVASRPLAYFIFIAWQAIVGLTAVAIIFGPTLQGQAWVADLARSTRLSMSLGAQGLEWGETPFWVDPIALLGLALVAFNFLVPIGKSKGAMYVTLWYFMAAFVWTFLTYAMGNFIPEYGVSGSSAGSRRWPVHPRPGGIVRHAAWLGHDVLHRPHYSEKAHLESRVIAGWLLGPGVLLPAPRYPPFPLHAHPDVPSIRSHHLNDCG